MIAIRLNPFHYNETVTRPALAEMEKIPGCCDEVWLAMYSYEPLEVHAKKAELIGEYIDYLKAKGIRPVVEFGTNLGHNDYTDDTPPVRTFEKMRGSNGFVAQGSFCPVGENFLTYQCEVIKLYAAKQPYGIYLDDDLRIEWHGNVGLGCFCENCIAEFNREGGTAYTLEEVASLIDTDLSVRERYVAMNRRHLYTYAKRMSEAAMSVCPTVRMGWEDCLLTAANGDDHDFVYEGMYEATGKDVLSRPGAFYYNDNNPRAVLDKVLNTSYQNVTAPDYIKVRRPEIENTSHTVMGKTAAGTCVEATLNLAYGCNGLSFSMCQSGTEPMDLRVRMWKYFAKHRPFWQGLIKDQQGGTGVSGIRLAYYKDVWKAMVPGRYAWMDVPKASGRQLVQIGLPLSYEERFCGVTLLHPDLVPYLSDEDIRDLLAQNVITDGLALEKLAERGYSFPVQVESHTFAHNEVYTDHPANGASAGKQGMVDMFTPGVTFQQFAVEEGCNVLAKTAGGQNSCVMTKVSGGGTWAFIGSCLWGTMINGVKRNQLLYLADHLSGGLAAYLDTPAQVTVIPRATADGRCKAVTLQNISIDETGDLEVVVKDPVSLRFVLSRPGYADAPVDFREENGRVRVQIPSIAPWATATLRAL